MCTTSRRARCRGRRWQAAKEARDAEFAERTRAGSRLTLACLAVTLRPTRARRVQRGSAPGTRQVREIGVSDPTTRRDRLVRRSARPSAIKISARSIMTTSPMTRYRRGHPFRSVARRFAPASVSPHTLTEDWHHDLGATPSGAVAAVPEAVSIIDPIRDPGKTWWAT